MPVASILALTRSLRLNKKDKNEITVYTSDSLQSSPVGLTLGGILLLAVLGGGDYDTVGSCYDIHVPILNAPLQVGLAKCGTNIAHALARSGYGDSLLTATQTMTNGQLQTFLVGWREQLRAELATNSHGYLATKQRALSMKIPNTFPSIRVLKLYVHPTTSWSEGFAPPPVDSWTVKLPSLPELALYCTRKFGWTPLDIVGKFKKLIFPGVCTRRLSQV
jgi:Holliday junction resolvase YEN1